MSFYCKVSHQVKEELIKRANDFGIDLKDVALTHLAFGDDFTKAIESKQVMFQEVVSGFPLIKT